MKREKMEKENIVKEVCKELNRVKRDFSNLCSLN
ncbi:hypothetical protein CC194727_CC194727_01568 [Campylobacter coli]|nr:hypothetical protein CC194727_CC194727_01568 [Campylobacter coli]